ncbi:adenylate cyclase [biofilm metagenome]
MRALLKFLKTCIAILLIGVIGFWVSHNETGSYVEEEFGLDWLFKLRGPLPPPQDIVIVSIDQASAEILRLPDDPVQWPRTYYAQLIDKINEQQPAVLAFNIHFGEAHEAITDQMLAKAMVAKKNVILSSYLKQKVLPSTSDLDAIQEQTIDPIPLFSRAALGTPPFPIPKTPSTVVKEIYKYSAGDVAIFPVSIYQYFVIKETYPEILKILITINPELYALLPKTFSQLIKKFDNLQILQEIQDALSKDVATSQLVQQLTSAARYSPKINLLLDSLSAMSEHGNKFYLNYYGDVGAIKTVSFYQALVADSTGNPDLFRNKIVMIGYSDNLEPEKQQGFYTPFSKASGKVISPIEIAATGVANMVGHSWLKPLPGYNQSILVLFWGILLSGIYCLLTYRAASVVLLLLTGGYIGFCYWSFVSNTIWLPLALPILQAVVILLWKSAAYFKNVKSVSERYLPRDVFDKNTRNPHGMHQYGNLMQGVCLATDAGQYTTLSETISPLQLHELINEYYASIFPRVKSRKGLISDVIGDAMLAVWAAKKPDGKLRLNACHAALEIKAAITRFNEESDYHLATRMGLHFGEMRLGNVGSQEHYEYRAVGDTVNTATRIEGLNKLLGTRILVSSAVIDGLQGFLTRELGTFLLKGKAQAITVHELIGKIDEISNLDPTWPQFAALFAEALAYYKTNDWEKALECFQIFQLNYPDDGPTHFYINYLQKQINLSAESTKELIKDLSNERAGIIDVGNITM